MLLKYKDGNQNETKLKQLNPRFTCVNYKTSSLDCGFSSCVTMDTNIAEEHVFTFTYAPRDGASCSSEILVSIFNTI